MKRVIITFVRADETPTDLIDHEFGSRKEAKKYLNKFGLNLNEAIGWDSAERAEYIIKVTAEQEVSIGLGEPIRKSDFVRWTS